MGESAAQTVKEIEEVRGRLDGEIRELEERLPPAYVAKRVVGALTVGTSGTVFWWAVRRTRKRRQKRKAESRPVEAVVQLVPERWATQVERAIGDGSWRRLAAYAAGMWAVFKIAEVRQLRRMNRMLASRT
jgi:hypothetical protein